MTAAKKAAPRKAAPRKPVGGDLYHDIVVEVRPPKKPLRATVADRTIIVPPPNRTVLRNLYAAPTDADLDTIGEILLGDQAEEISQWFEDKPEAWMVFVAMMQAHFFGEGADDVEGKSPDSSDS